MKYTVIYTYIIYAHIWANLICIVLDNKLYKEIDDLGVFIYIKGPRRRVCKLDKQ